MRMIVQPKEIKTLVQKTSPQEKDQTPQMLLLELKRPNPKQQRCPISKLYYSPGSESLACAIKEMAKGQDEQRKSEIMLWLEHESKEKAKD